MKHVSAVLAATGVLVLSLAPAGCREDGAGEGEAVAARDSTAHWCADYTRPNELCPVIPHDVHEILRVGYAELSPETQRPFDVFSWQSFVALNWPADSAGQPLQVSVGDSLGAPRVWDFYQSPDAVFGLAGPPPTCGAGAPRGTRMLYMMAKNHHGLSGGEILEATGQPLIDQNLNYAMYEIRMNPDEVAYIMRDSLNTAQGQQGKTIEFPSGFYTDTANGTGGIVGAMEIKATWRILASGDDASRYFSRPAVIYVAAANSQSGQPMCVNATVGLVGMHIIHKTRQQPGWVWSTFEHVDNAPTCTAGQAGCGAGGTRWSFFNAQCDTATCPWNNPPVLQQGDSTFLWAPQQGYAQRYATGGRYGTQVVRLDSVYPETDSVTAEWQQELQGTVWANYRLIGSQWVNPEVPTPGTGIPTTLGNTTLETYIPTTSSCTGCHVQATDAAGNRSDFSFLLALAKNDSVPAHFRAIRPTRAQLNPPAVQRRDTGRAGRDSGRTGRETGRAGRDSAQRR